MLQHLENIHFFRRRFKRTTPRCLAGVFLLAAVLPAISQQQPSEEVDFRRAPEAWAMKYYASAMLFTGFGAPKGMEPWETTLGLEVVHIPSLDEDERRVGFGGSKPEDLNKAPAIIRPRLTIGLPADFSATFSYAPPLDVFDAKAALYAASLNRPLWETDSFRLGARVFAQHSNIRGDFTCPEDELGNPDLAPCSHEHHSNDIVRLTAHGVELMGSYRLDGIPGVTTDLVTYAGVSGQYLDLEFEVDATRGNQRDNRRLYTDGYTWAAAGGVMYPITERMELAAGVFYAPLSVQRPGKNRRNEPLVNGRVHLGYTF